MKSVHANQPSLLPSFHYNRFHYKWIGLYWWPRKVALGYWCYGHIQQFSACS